MTAPVDLPQLTALQEDAQTATSFLAITKGYGHMPSREGQRMAGFFYSNEDAIAADTLPAHSMGAITRLVAALPALIAELTAARERLAGEAERVRDAVNKVRCNACGHKNQEVRR